MSKAWKAKAKELRKTVRRLIRENRELRNQSDRLANIEYYTWKAASRY